MENALNYIELFAGCGGLSLGLEAAGFELYFANELSPMAAETFAFNILNEDLKSECNPTKTLWLRSNFKKGDKARLRESPFSIIGSPNTDLKREIDIKGKMIVGDINLLNDFLTKNKKFTNRIRQDKIDLVSGGPPCQSFSLAGRRERNNKRNKLPWSFAEFVKLVKPKLVLLENVSGILRAFKEGEQKYYAWFEVAKAFGLIGYVPICMHINAKYFGLPQNRPRFILLGIRKDLTKSFKNANVLRPSLDLIKKLKQKGEDLKIEEVPDFRYYELNKKNDIPFFLGSLLLPKPKSTRDEDFITVKEGIDNLKDFQNDGVPDMLEKNSYDTQLENVFGKLNPHKDFLVKNHNHRFHSTKIKNRFRLLRLIEKFENGTKVKLIHALKTGSLTGLDKHMQDKLISGLELNGVKNHDDLAIFFEEHKSRKHSQRALKKNQPAPATLSIPDDVCHYDDKQNRTLTIREMARIQSFPDWFEFRSKDTTGGTNRRIEVPNYTQVGNAVPPLLGKALGEWLKDIINNTNHEV